MENNFNCPRQSVHSLFKMWCPPYLVIVCHSERSVSEVEESFTFKILRLFAAANFAPQTTQDDSIKNHPHTACYLKQGFLSDIHCILRVDIQCVMDTFVSTDAFYHKTLRFTSCFCVNSLLFTYKKIPPFSGGLLTF